MESLTDAMGSTRLSDEPEEPEQLLFNPSPNSGIDETILNNIPRYLFRLATPNSAGITNERWVCSESVRQNTPSSMEDVFFNMDNEKQIKVARILDSHLWWRQARNPDDNFVSWTSSLLFVLQYIYYRHYKDGTSLAEIKLYVVDTMKFPRGTFMLDLNLIDIFRDYNDGLENLWSLRNRPNLYFGEYLSQGSLMIENKCQAITAEVIFKQDRLRRIQPHFAELHHGKREDKPEWVREVNRLRNTIWPPPGSPLISPTELGDRLQAVQEILQHVSADWKCPVAIYFAALIGPEGFIRGQDTANDKVVGTDPRSVYLPRELFKRFCP
ncbi:uncharacterized protein N7473_012770 [Penicillium subrubescens]|uniref:DUF7587 domain-containing protein n=1 Tax=Penicillium subrubescens TaxID=1316194 RepID=A0A1Q5UGJ6_9EURO|nr:uncharacterized protein N7473_012770 [Penicillium subrubescens]KAJ5875423.1 hypothetical protein N7473_012770 [Penicillium subrubescens]OKP11586.1 hypothetical protein PENSUB_2888 [Penicillium subrubescens]